jgi:hypothetical protein
MRLPRLALAGTLISALALTLVVAGSAMAGGRPLVATLTPGAEVGPGTGDPNPAASGTFASTLNPGHNEFCWSMTWSNLSANATAAHVHVGPAGVAGGVVIPLTTTATTSGSTSGCTTIDDGLAKAIMQDPAGYYVNVHTSVNPPGAIRGQLAPPED